MSSESFMASIARRLATMFVATCGSVPILVTTIRRPNEHMPGVSSP